MLLRHEGSRRRARRLQTSISSRCPGLNRGPTVYEGEFPHGNQANFHDVSTKCKQDEVDPHAASRSLVHEPDQVALGLLEAQASWLVTRDSVQLRRALLRIMMSLDEQLAPA